MKKVLQISNYMYPHIGGIEQVSRDIMKALDGKYEQKVICFDSSNETVCDTLDGVSITRVSSFAKIASQSLSFDYKKELKKVMREFKPDYVIFHYPNPFVSHFLLKYLKKKKFKFILWWHLDITKQKIIKLLFNSQNKKLLRYADKVVATSPNYIDGSRYLVKYKDKCVVIPCSVDEKRLKYEDIDIDNANKIIKNYNGKTICFAFGRHVEYKGLTYLIKAAEHLDDNYIIIIGGTGPLTGALKLQAKGDNRIIFTGKLSDSMLKSYLLACDIFCFPSITKNEAFGIGLAEAMFYGKAVITFNIPGSGVNYVSLKNVTGLEVENKNYYAFAKAIEYLAKNDNSRLLFGTNAKERVQNNFLEVNFHNNVEKLFGELNE